MKTGTQLSKNDEGNNTALQGQSFIELQEMCEEAIGRLAGGEDKYRKSYGRMVFRELKKSCYNKITSSEDLPIMIEEMITQLSGINPKDQIEGMIAMHMIATHKALMNCFTVAGVELKFAQNYHMTLSSINKLSRTFIMQNEALSRHRGKAQQKMTVEHVHVNAGGKAIIGNLSKSVGGQNSSKGVIKNNE